MLRPRPAWSVRGLAAAVALAAVLWSLDLPLVEDSLFWWVPKGLWMAEHGPALSAAGDLPTVMARALGGHDLLPQWAGGLPDFDHPPLWYLWLGLFLSASPSVLAVHLACLLPAVLAAVGWVALAERLGRPWAGLVPLTLPPVIAQLLRPDLDLPLLAVVPWALVALLDGAWWRFALLGLVAPWIKEPGVLLVVPAALLWARDRRPAVGLAALSPLLGLLAWRLLHGHLAAPERLPDGLLGYLSDLAVVARLVLWEQGRWALVLGTLLGTLLGLSLRRTPAPLDWRRGGPVLLFAVTWLAFFAAVGFFATRDAEQSLTHVRYFLPGLCALAVLLAVLLTQALPALLLPAAVLPGLLHLSSPSPFGPEASLFGAQAALAEWDATPFIASSIQQGRTVWVGSYQAAALLQPWAGGVQPAPPAVSTAGGRLRIYSEKTDLGQLQVGDIVLAAAYGEPTGALQRALELSTLDRWTRGHATVTAWQVQGSKLTPGTPIPPVSAPVAPGSR